MHFWRLQEHALDDQLYRYALQGDQEELIEAARYFESPPPADGERPPRFDRAVLLYSKAGLLDTALDLASRSFLSSFLSFFFLSFLFFLPQCETEIHQKPLRAGKDFFLIRISFQYQRIG